MRGRDNSAVSYRRRVRPTSEHLSTLWYLSRLCLKHTDEPVSEDVENAFLLLSFWSESLFLCCQSLGGAKGSFVGSVEAVSSLPGVLHFSGEAFLVIVGSFLVESSCHSVHIPSFMGKAVVFTIFFHSSFVIQGFFCFSVEVFRSFVPLDIETEPFIRRSSSRRSVCLLLPLCYGML